ncbi:MAG: rhombotarget A [Moraxellaceae bacterium]
MLKRTISLSLLCMASHAYSANIIVTTTADEDGTNPSACSLREAIKLINGEMITDPADPNKKIYKDLLNSTEGFGGCGGKDAVSDVFYAPIIDLPFGKTYLLEREVRIERSLTVRSDDVGNSSDRLGVNNPVIRAVGAHRLFDINDASPEATSIQTVVIQQVNLEGCAKTDTSRVCETNGGIISNNESLLLSSLRVSGGRAGLLGGAVYSTTPQASVTLTIVDMQNNHAGENGAALSFERPRFTIGGSYLSQNSVPAGSDGVVLHVRQGIEQKDAAGVDVAVVTTRSGAVLDSTFYQNDAAVIDLREGIVINNTTLVDNRAGVRFIAPRGGANLANSIVAGNTQFDCQFNSGDKTHLNNILFISGCDRPSSPTLQTSLIEISGTGDTTLFAEQVDGQCAKPPARGLLCRPQPVATTSVELQDGTEVFNPYLRPRLLTEYTSLNESKIVNKGRNISAIQQALTCTQNDQRSFERTLCDIGAIELVIDSNRKVNGLDIRFGGVARLSLAALLGDGDLIPAEVCPSIFQNRQPDGGVWLEGCLTYVKAPQKGLMTLEQNGEITYRPSSNFHGVDRFNYDVVTTTSRFSDGANDQKINIETTIVQEPVAGDSNRKVDLAGGAFGWVGLFGLFGLVAIARRKTQKYKTKQQGAC